MKLRPRLFIACALACALCLIDASAVRAQTPTASETDFPRRFEGSAAPPSAAAAGRTAYAGLALRQNPEGVVVVAIQPGPFAGDGFKSATIWRGDLVVSINGQALDPAGYRQLIKSLAPGDTLRVVYRRAAKADPYAAVPRGDPAGEERSVEIVLDDAARWRGTIGRGRPIERAVAPAQTGEFEELILVAAEEFGLRSAPGGLDALLGSQSVLQRRLLDPNSLPAVVHAIERPLSLDRVATDLAAPILPLAGSGSLEASIRAAHRFILRTLDIPDLQSLADVAGRLLAARRDHQGLAVALVQAMRDEGLAASPQLPHYLQIVRESPALVPLAPALLPEAARLAADLEQFAQDLSRSPQPVPPELAERVRAAVEGPVLGARLIDGELWVVGGEQANRYDLGLVAAVFDTGGPDSYAFSERPQGSYQIVIDRSGDDVYEATADFAGPVTAVFSVSILHDRAGDDRYISRRQGAIAAGLFGVALLIDEAGTDEYLSDTDGAGWAQGVGVYGAGLLVDRAGDDRYHAQVLSQGVGGPGGIGVIVDVAGDDDYLANGPYFPSRYATAGVFAGLSQGFGLGIRGYAAGGVGAILELAGDDAYSVGEYGQGAGYFQGLGILYDAAGNDRYLGVRYAQGSAAHQAAGVLVDQAGDDSYACSGPAAQGAAWDQSSAMLLDGNGDDSYSASGLAQASAAQQALAILVDSGGEDSYACASPCLGHSGDNVYHYDAGQILNFSLLLDRGDGADTYAQPRSNDSRLRTGEPSAERPAASSCCGLFIDE